MKRIRTAAFGLLGIMALGTVAAQPAQAIQLDTGNGRMNTRLRSDERVVTEFERAITGYRLALLGGVDLPSSEDLQEEANAIDELNDALQSHGFNYAISDEYKDASNEVKQKAELLNEVIQESADATYESLGDVNDAAERVSDSKDEFDAAATSLEVAAANYEPPSPLWVVPLFAVLVGAIVAVIVVAVRKSNKKAAAALFGESAEGAALNSSQRKLAVRLYNDLISYEKALAENNTTLKQALEMSTLELSKDDEKIASLGSYASIAYEFRALVESAAGNSNEATLLAQKAASISHSGLITERAKSLTT